jgi:hypothetical protein
MAAARTAVGPRFAQAHFGHEFRAFTERFLQERQPTRR